MFMSPLVPCVTSPCLCPGLGRAHHDSSERSAGQVGVVPGMPMVSAKETMGLEATRNSPPRPREPTPSRLRFPNWLRGGLSPVEAGGGGQGGNGDPGRCASVPEPYDGKQ